jgi:hypothetical protein
MTIKIEHTTARLLSLPRLESVISAAFQFRRTQGIILESLCNMKFWQLLAIRRRVRNLISFTFVRKLMHILVTKTMLVSRSSWYIESFSDHV